MPPRTRCMVSLGVPPPAASADFQTPHPKPSRARYRPRPAASRGVASEPQSPSGRWGSAKCGCTLRIGLFQSSRCTTATRPCRKQAPPGAMPALCPCVRAMPQHSGAGIRVGVVLPSGSSFDLRAIVAPSCCDARDVRIGFQQVGGRRHHRGDIHRRRMRLQRARIQQEIGIVQELRATADHRVIRPPASTRRGAGRPATAFAA